jgi:hypothetical protein
VSAEEALYEIVRLKGRQFDPEVVEAFERVLPGLEAQQAESDPTSGAVIRHEEVSDMAKGKILVVDDEIYIVHILDFSLGHGRLRGASPRSTESRRSRRRARRSPI